MSYEQPQGGNVIIIPGGVGEEGTNIFAWVIGFLIIVIIIMAIVWALAYQRNASKDPTEGDEDADTEDAGTGTGGKYVKCPTKISNTQKAQCEWSRLDARNTRCLASKSKKCTEETATEECSILGKWMGTEQGKYVCNFKSAKELVFNDAELPESEQADSGDVDSGDTEETKPENVELPSVPTTECSFFKHCNETEYNSQLSCNDTGGNALYCSRGYCPAGFVNNGGCWNTLPQ